MPAALLAAALIASPGLNADQLQEIRAYSLESVVPGWLPEGFRAHRLTFFEAEEPGATFEFRQTGVDKSLTVQTASGGIGDVMLMTSEGDEVRVERRIKGESQLLGRIEFETGRLDSRQHSVLNWVDRKRGKLRFVSALGEGVQPSTFKKFVERLQLVGG